MIYRIIILLTLLIPMQITMPLFVAEKLTQEDYCLAWVIYNEARGETHTGARAVLDVVLFRMKKRNLSACEVVAQKHQFQGYSKEKVKNVSRNMLTLYFVVSRMHPVVNAEYFHAVYVHPTWVRKYKKIAKIGKHIFYMEKNK